MCLILYLFFALSLLVVLFWFRIRCKQTSRDPYDLFHLAFNQLEPHFPPQTEWLNMGYWRNATTFPDACKVMQDLALRLLRHIQYHGGNVLGQSSDLSIHSARISQRCGGLLTDVGHGTGDSLLLLLQEPSIPRPARLTGITSLTSHYLHSRDRIQKLMCTQRSNHPPVALFRGDAVLNQSRVPWLGHPLDPSRLEEFYDVILALDCAYHFHSREEFLRQAFRALGPSGRIGLADICFDDSSNVLANWIAARFVPQENVTSWPHYRERLMRIGYVSIEVEDITDQVYPGFLAFLMRKGWGWWLFARVFGVFIASRSRFVLVSAAKPP